MLIRWMPHFTDQRWSMVKAMRLCLLLSFALLTSVSHAADNSHRQIRQLAQLAEYIGADYVAAVDHNTVVNLDEYQEMLEFAQLLVDKSAMIAKPALDSHNLQAEAGALQQAVQNKQDVRLVRQLSTQLRRSLLALMPQSTLPDRLSPKRTVESLFKDNCTTCHGLTGKGDGTLSTQLNPAPTNFTDKERASNRSVLGLFDAISNGIDDTAMPGFNQLTEQQRWSLAFYVGSLAFQSNPKPSVNDSNISLSQLVNFSPAQIAAGQSQEVEYLAEWLRAHPEQLFDKQQNPLAISRERLTAAHAAYQKGDYQAASELAISAYLDGFELVENSLDTQDPTLRKNIEVNMMKLRQVINRAQQNGELDALMAETLAQLSEADRLQNESTLSSGTLFTASLIILLREGLEALLVIIALMTVLIRTQRQDALKYVHTGWIVALLSGGATWVAAQSLISISGASREVMEGVAALFAALVLFYVGIWMHNKTHAAQWQAYIQKHVNERLRSGTLWGLAALAFIAVYREVFETVLFYESLLTQAAEAQYSVVAGGFLLGVALLAVLSWVLIRYSIKLPIARFFSTTTYLLLALSFILTGKGISALQEAALIGMSPLPVNVDMSWIGLKSTWQGITAQALILVVFMVFIWGSKVKQRLRPSVAKAPGMKGLPVTASEPD